VTCAVSWGSLFADCAAAGYVRCGCIGSPVYWFSGGSGGGGGVPVHCKELHGS